MFVSGTQNLEDLWHSYDGEYFAYLWVHIPYNKLHSKTVFLKLQIVPSIQPLSQNSTLLNQSCKIRKTPASLKSGC